jgi:outer membrane lipoprotein-sorting protein
MLKKIAAVLVYIAVATSVPASAQSANKIIKKHLKAMGGVKKIKSVETVKMTGTVEVQGNVAPIVFYMKRPDLFCIESKTDFGVYITGFDGENSWIFNSYAGDTEPKMQSDEESVMSKEDYDIDGPLVDYKKKGNKVELAGKEDVDGKEVFKLIVTHPSGKERTLVIDAETYLVVSESYTQMSDGVVTDHEMRLRDHKKVDGLTYAHVFEEVMNGEVQTKSTIENVEINTGIDDAIFKPRTE